MDLETVRPTRARKEARPAARQPLREEPSPRARLRDAGAQALSDAELLTLIIGPAGGSAAMDNAHVALEHIGGLGELRRTSPEELLRLPGLTRARAERLVAALELGRRAFTFSRAEQPKISSPEDVEALMRPRLAHLDREHFVILLLDTKNRVIASPTVSVGTLTSSLVHPREVFKPAVRVSAASMVLVHNHPSGDPKPSEDDLSVTKRLKNAGDIFGIEVLDHVIIGDAGRFFSMKEKGQL